MDNKRLSKLIELIETAIEREEQYLAKCKRQEIYVSLIMKGMLIVSAVLAIVTVYLIMMM
jgi:hypothetical protein